MSNEYELVDEVEEIKQVKFNNILSHIFGILFIFDLIRGFLLSDAFSYLNAIIWLGLFISCLIGKTLSTLRLDIFYKK